MLAQHWLYGKRAPTPYDGYLQSRLELPDKFNPHSSVAILNKLAERIVFTDDVPSILYEMNDNKQLTFNGVLSSAHLPYDCFWLEYSTRVGMGYDDIEVGHFGALVQRIGTSSVRMICVTGLKVREDEEMVSTLTHIIRFDQWPPANKDKQMSFAVDYAFNKKALYVNDRQIAELSSIVLELIFGIFLVTQPRCYTDEQVKWKASHAAKRAKSNKPPLLEYRKIRLHICKPRKQYEHRPATGSLSNTSALRDVEDDASVQHRRYHKVMGHFRHYTKHDPPRSVWIEAH